MSEARGLILPATGRGTARRVVEGLVPTHSVARIAPSTMLRMVPLPVPGRK